MKEMKGKILYIYVWMLAMFTACTDELHVVSSEIEEECWVSLDFGHEKFESIDVLSRYALSDVQESLVNNLYVYVFSPDGQRIYSHYFDASNKKASATEVTSSSDNCWYVNNRSTNSNAKTSGTIKMKAPSVTGGKLFLIANVDNTTLRVSSDKLNTVTNLNELQAITAYLSEEITARTPGFLMVAEETVTITNSGGTSTITITGDSDNDGNRADLVRLDAKVEVKIKTAEGTAASTTIDGVKQTVKEFVPKEWQVINLPRYSNLTLQNNDYEITDGYFNGPELHFEQTEYTTNGDTIHSFAFYMLENREIPQNNVEEYHQRDTRKTNADGSYNTDNGLWKNAPERGTYLIIKGEVQMEVSTTSTTPQLLVADVVYYIHLGDIKNRGVNDYNVNRNTHYTYNVTIKGVNSIEVEVNSSQPGQTFSEPESGVTGNVYKAEEEIFTFDAHYGQRVYRILADNIVVNHSDANDDYLTWYVKTPFGREGSPKEESGTAVPDDLDYKWVHFMVNPNNTTYNQHYPGDGSPLLMDVIEFVQYLREEKKKLQAGQTSAFVNGELYVTVFVDEFYYEKHPITGAESPTLWKEFVNQPNRLMHLLCNNKSSLDGASSSTGSIITIRQRSIQTPYDPNIASLQNAWGCETMDEYADSGFFFYNATEMISTIPDISTTEYTSRKNGLYNTVKLLGLNFGSSKWSSFLDYTDETLLQNSKKTLLYSILTRNRDNNGDGYIDAEELRWYVASLEQLYGIYIGGLGLDADAQLYRPAKANLSGTYADGTFENCYKWREHVISSTKHEAQNLPIVIWAEEGVSTSYYKQEMSWGKDNQSTFSIRCLRNLGLGNHPTAVNIENMNENVPTGTDELIQVSSSGSGTNAVYTFDLMNVNETSLRRIYYEGELPTSDENSKLACPYYKGFVTGGWETYSSTVDGYEQLRTLLDNGGSPNENILNDHYRVPNVREIALMYAFCPISWWNVTSDTYDFFLSTTHYARSAFGTRWLFGNNNGNGFASLDKSVYKTLRIRYVKDIE